MRTLFVAAFALAVTAGAAFAHANLVAAKPAAFDMAMPPPTEIRLKFSEAIEAKLAKITIVGSDKTAVAIGPLKLDPSDGTTLIVPIAGPLPDGNYTVNWQVVGSDGHKTKGNYGFESMK